MAVIAPRKHWYPLISALLLVIVSTLVGCLARETPKQSRQEPTRMGPVEFREIHSYEVEGQLWTLNSKQTISPDSRWVLATQTDEKGVKMIALPLNTAAGGVQVLHSADRNWVSNHLFGYYPLGWVSPTRCLFVVEGWQNTGPHKGKRGVAIFASDLGKNGATTQEVAFLNLPEGMVKSGLLIPETKKVYLHVPKAIWEYDLDSNKMRLITGRLPDYDGLFSAKPSPDGRYFVYNLCEDKAHGVYLVDTQTGRQRPLLPTSETVSFHPAWSPDGKHIAAYTVYKKKGANPSTNTNVALKQGVTWQEYDILEGEDGPQPVADAITVIDTNGKIIQTIRVEGKKIGYFRWGPSSNAIGFLAGTIKTFGGGIDQFTPESVWLTPSGEALSTTTNTVPVKVAVIQRDKPGENVHVLVWGVDPDGGGVLYNEHRPDKTLIKHARLESSKDKLDEFEGGFADWWMEYVCRDIMISTVQGENWSAVWAFQTTGRREIIRFAPNRHTIVLGCNGDLLAVANCPLWSPDMARPGAKVDKGVIKVFRIVRP